MTASPDSESAAQHLLLRREYPAALAGFLRAIEEQPTNWWAWLGAGQAASYLDRIPDALRYIQRAVELSPRDATVIALYARVLERSDEPTEAKKQMAQALELDSRDQNASPDRRVGTTA